MHHRVPPPRCLVGHTCLGTHHFAASNNFENRNNTSHHPHFRNQRKKIDAINATPDSGACVIPPDVKIFTSTDFWSQILINIFTQNIFLFGVELSDYHNPRKRAASRSTVIINSDATNQRVVFVPDAISTKNWCQNLASN